MHPARPGFSATLTGRSPWRSVLRSGPDSRGGEPGGLAHRAGSPRRTRERTFTAAFCARADNDGSGRGILGSVHRVLARDRAPASLACGPGRSDAAAPRGSSPSWGTRVGPRFCLQTSLLGESCAPASPALAAAARPLRARRSWCVLSGDASSPGPRGEMLRGNRRPDGAFVPWPRCARRSQAALHRRPSQFGRRRGSDGVELTSQQHRLASSPSRPRLILSLLLPACCQVLKDARAPADAGQLVPVSVVPTRPRGAAVGHS